MNIKIPDAKIARWKKQVEEAGYDFNANSKEEPTSYIISLLDEEFDMEK